MPIQSQLLGVIALLALSFSPCSAANIAFFYALEKDVSRLEVEGAVRVRAFQVGNISVQEFSYESHRIYAVKMGSGVVQTCLSAQALLCRQNCDLAISVGPIGGLTDGAKTGSWYRVQRVVAWQKGSQKDERFELHQKTSRPIGDFFEIESEPRVVKELPTIDIASGEVFVASDTFRRELANQTKCAGVGMNLFGLLESLNSHQVKGIHLRVVSDSADSRASETFRTFVSNYEGKGAELALQIIRELPEDKTSPGSHDALRKLLRTSLKTTENQADGER